MTSPVQFSTYCSFTLPGLPTPWLPLKPLPVHQFLQSLWAATQEQAWGSYVVWCVCTCSKSPWFSPYSASGSSVKSNTQSLRFHLIQLYSREALDEPLRNAATGNSNSHLPGSQLRNNLFVQLEGSLHRSRSCAWILGLNAWPILFLALIPVIWCSLFPGFTEDILAFHAKQRQARETRASSASSDFHFRIGAVPLWDPGSLKENCRMRRWESVVLPPHSASSCVLTQGRGSPSPQQIFWHRIICSTSRGQQNKLVWRQDTDWIPVGKSSLI